MRIRDLHTLFLLVVAPTVANAQDYLVVTGESVNVRVTPSGTVIGQARQGDVFEFKGRDGQWLKVNMFSGEYRYIHSSLVHLTDSVPSGPNESTRRQAFRALVRAEDRAIAEADRQIPPTTSTAIYRNIDLQRLLDDRHKLTVCHEHGIQPAHYDALRVEGIRKGWMP